MADEPLRQETAPDLLRKGIVGYAVGECTQAFNQLGMFFKMQGTFRIVDPSHQVFLMRKMESGEFEQINKVLRLADCVGGIEEHIHSCKQYLMLFIHFCIASLTRLRWLASPYSNDGGWESAPRSSRSPP